MKIEIDISSEEIRGEALSIIAKNIEHQVFNRVYMNNEYKDLFVEGVVSLLKERKDIIDEIAKECIPNIATRMGHDIAKEFANWSLFYGEYEEGE